uniref:Putative reverse transcriptase domain-containing protein n=1 Tax=Tanacetum cinerariifolium TaxID=118510 RepID=A0A6L2KAG7_TANCI|nr:putative reverse transcriptase domain-containing protein [Tanacetum cinerariifolium]
MPFGLTYAPSILMVLMNRLYKPHLDEFFIVVIDDILIYSNSKEDYEAHLKLVLEPRKKEKLFAKLSKHEFWLQEGREQEEALQTLKDNLCNAPILSFPDGPEDFVVYCDASNQGLGCVLMQRGKSEAFKEENVPAERLHGLDQQIKRKEDESLYFMDRIWVPLVGGVRTIIMDEAHKTRNSVHPGANKMYYDQRDMYWWPGMKRDIATSPVLWAEFGESSLFGPKLVLETTNKVVLIKEKLKVARDRQKSYADNRRKLAPRYVGPFEILERIDPVAYRLRLPEELSSVHATFHVSNLKKCLADVNLHVPLDEIKIDKTLRFVEEPIEIIECKVRSLKRSKISLVKVCWNSKRGPEFTWEREDHTKSKYPQLFVDRAVEPSS